MWLLKFGFSWSLCQGCFGDFHILLGSIISLSTLPKIRDFHVSLFKSGRMNSIIVNGLMLMIPLVTIRPSTSTQLKNSHWKKMWSIDFWKLLHNWSIIYLLLEGIWDATISIAGLHTLSLMMPTFLLRSGPWINEGESFSYGTGRPQRGLPSCQP